MKKKILLAGAVALMAAVAVTGYSAYSKSNVSDLLSANVEALARGEGDQTMWATLTYLCPGTGMQWACSCEQVSTTRCRSAACIIDC